MQLPYTKVQTPRGAKDILPPEAYRKSRLEAKAAAFIERWGYSRVYTPTLEFYDALAQGDGPLRSTELYRFVDRDGTTLALRPEMTTPIARMAATRFTDEDMPLRLYYIGSVFRYDEPQAGRHREFTQVGVELLGADQPAADAEIVALAIGALESLGIASLQVDLGQIGYFYGLIQQIGDAAFASELKQALLDRDYVRYEALIRGADFLAPAERKALLALPYLRGDGDALDEAIELAKGVPASLAAVENLKQTYDLVKAYGLGDRVAVDLGMVKDMEYYSGLLLEAYTPELGFTLCTGGRYDALVGKFGAGRPATGFAFGVERAMLALDRQGRREEEGRPDVFLYAPRDQASTLFAVAAHLRSLGVSVEADVDGLDRSKAMAYAQRRRIRRVATVTQAGDAPSQIELEFAMVDGSGQRGLPAALADWVATSNRDDSR